MPFNQANVDNRLRYTIRGRVIIFTTSTHVEFLDHNLQTTIPIMYQNGLPPIYGMTLIIECDGILTFDVGSQVKIIDVGPYKRFEFVQNAAFPVAPPDPFIRKIVADAQFAWMVQATNAANQVTSLYILVTSATGNVNVRFFVQTPFSVAAGTEAANLAKLKAIFVPGSVYKGPAGYRDSGFSDVAYV